MKRRGIILMVLIISILFMPSFKTLKDAYQEEGMEVFGETHWMRADMPVKYSINELGSADIPQDAEFDAINNAFKTWTSVVCDNYNVDLTTQYLGKTSDRVVFFDGKNTIDFVENKNEWPPEAGANAIAFTVPSIRADGIIVEADLRFNGVNYTWSTTGGYGRMDVETIALHELGHFFGLADLYDNYSCYVIQAVMCGYGGGGTKRTLKQDDKNGICYLYDPNKYKECKRDSDCNNNFVCKPYVNLEGRTTTFCLEPYCVPQNLNDPYCNNPLNTKAVDPGNRCGDINNTPLNIGDDVYCKNQMCLGSGVCSSPCEADSDCPRNMKCETITVKIDETTNATLKACNTPPGCSSNRDCPQDRACTIFSAGSSLISVCNNYIGNKEVGEECLSNTDCKTGICYNSYCSAFCSLKSDCPVFGADYTCTKDVEISFDGLKQRFSICTRNGVIIDAGIDANQDVFMDSIYSDSEDIVSQDIIMDSGRDGDVYVLDYTSVDTLIMDYSNSDSSLAADKGESIWDGGLIKDISRIDIDFECICDETYGCDPDCECDPDCQMQVENSNAGCNCNFVE